MTSEPDQIRADIERTQRELSTDLDALTEKVSPPRIMERRVQRARATVTNVKDKIMGNTSQRASDMGGTVSSAAASAGDAVSSAASSAKDTLASTASSAAGTVSSVPDLARQRARGNPLAAGLIAFGAGWLLSSLLPATEPEAQVASKVKDLATEQGRPVVEQLGQAGQQAAQELRESAQQRAQSVKETVSEAASTVADEAQSRATEVAGHAQEAGGRITEQARSSGS